MIIYLVRHGESINNVQEIFPDDDQAEYSLTPEGIKQAQLTGGYLSLIKADLLVSSPVKRASQTAQIISEKIGKKIIFDDRLREAGLGNLRGKDWRQLVSKEPEWYKEYFSVTSKYGIEKYSSIQKRMLMALQDFSDNDSIIMVSHLEPIRSLIAISLGISGEEARKIKISNASVSVLKLENPNGLETITINWLPMERYGSSEPERFTGKIPSKKARGFRGISYLQL
ncbi:MAG: histidine phosphatase family protein [Thermoprotei archaeon]